MKEKFYLVFFASMFFVGLAVWLVFIIFGLLLGVFFLPLSKPLAKQLARNVVVCGDQVCAVMCGQASDMTISGAVGQALYFPGLAPRFPKFTRFAEKLINLLFHNKLWVAEKNHIWQSVEYTELNDWAVFKLYKVVNEKSYSDHVAKVKEIEMTGRRIKVG